MFVVWPTLYKEDVSSLCEPFEISNKNSCLDKHGFSGFVFFDVGSVLIDLDWEAFFDAFVALTKPTHQFSLDKFIKTVKKINLNKKWAIGKICTHEYACKIIELVKANCNSRDDLEISIYDLKQADSKVVSHLRPRVFELVKQLKEKKFAVGLLSNTTSWHEHLLYEKIQPTKNFDISIFGCDWGCEKPAPEIYKIAQKEACKFIYKKFQHKLESKDIYFVDDTPANVKAALNVGWNARLVNLVKDEILMKLKHNEIDDFEFQHASIKRESLLFADQAAQRVEALFGNFL